MKHQQKQQHKQTVTSRLVSVAAVAVAVAMLASTVITLVSPAQAHAQADTSDFHFDAPYEGEEILGDQTEVQVELGPTAIAFGWIYAGTAPDARDIDFEVMDSSRTVIVDNLPGDGSTVYLTYFYLTAAGDFGSISTSFTSAEPPPVPVEPDVPVFVHPVNDDLNIPAESDRYLMNQPDTIRFEVDGAPDNIRYGWVYIGTSEGRDDVTSRYVGSSTSASIDIETDVSKVYITYWWNTGNGWQNIKTVLWAWAD